MHHDLKHRIQAMRDKLEGRAPVAEIQGSSQLFVTPSPECRRLVELADVRETDRILEPSAGTGAILQAIRDAVPRAKCDAVELHAGLARHLQAHFPEVRIWCGDFLEYHPERRYTRIIMNPPFHTGQATDVDLGRAFLRVASASLKRGGKLMLVANRQLPYEAALEASGLIWRNVAEDRVYKLLFAERR